MSSETVKEKRSRRRHNSFNKGIRQAKLFKDVAHLKPKEPHRYNKMHSLNCGIPGCVMCSNPRRIAKGNDRYTMQELRMRINQEEEKNE